MSEEAKAVQEAAKTAGKAIDVSAKLGSFFSKVIGDPLIEVGGITHDWAKYYRYTNLLKIKDKVDQIHKQRRVEGKTIPIPPRYAVPLIDAVSLEDDEQMQDMWAALIANATDPSRGVALKRVLISVLRQVEPLDAGILKLLATANWRAVPGTHGGGFNVARIAEEMKRGNKEVRLSLTNLFRLGLVWDQQPLKMGTPSMNSGLSLSNESTAIQPTPLGYELVELCSTTP